MKNFRKNTFGYAHHALLGVVVVAVIALVGVKVLTGIHAITYTSAGKCTASPSSVTTSDTKKQFPFTLKVTNIGTKNLKLANVEYKQYYYNGPKVKTIDLGNLAVPGRAYVAPGESFVEWFGGVQFSEIKPYSIFVDQFTSKNPSFGCSFTATLK